MGTIVIKDLEVHFNVGVPDLERANPQRLLISVELEHDFQAATRADDLAGTIDYFAVCERLMKLGEKREWKLIETLASDIADVVLLEFRPNRVVVEVKKFVIPQAQYVSVRLCRERVNPSSGFIALSEV